jgi:hypothetical protein
MELQVYLVWRLTFEVFTCQKTWVIALLTPEYEVYGPEDKCFGRRLMTFSTFYSFGPFGSNYLCPMNLFKIAPIPSWGPLPWLMPKKLQRIVQPPIIYGYGLTKYHGILLLN